MNLLNTCRRDRDAKLSADARKARRRLGPAVDALEERKVLSTTTTGAFDGMTYSYVYDSAAKAGTLTVTDAPGNHTIDVAATHPNLSPGDKGYDPARVNDVTGIELTDRRNDLSGGVNVVKGTKVSVVVNRAAGDNAFVNDEPSFTMTYGARAVTGPKTPVTNPPAAPTPLAAQSGTTLGLSWRLAPDATGGGTLFVQDVARGTNSADPKSLPIAINQDGGHVIFDTDWSTPFWGPAVKPGSNIKVVVAQHAGDLSVYDDRGSAFGGLRTEDRLQSGSIGVARGQTLTWTLSENVATRQATFTITSAATDKATYYIAPAYQNLSPGDPGYDPHSNPILGLTVTDSQDGSGGVSFDQGMSVSIVTKGGATFRNSSPYSMVKG